MCSRVLIPAAPTLRIVLLIVRVEHPAEAQDRPLGNDCPSRARDHSLHRHQELLARPLAARAAVLGRALAQLSSLN